MPRERGVEGCKALIEGGYVCHVSSDVSRVRTTMLISLLALPLRLLTFDLDDTLFPCGPVVMRANAALVDSLEAAGAPGLDAAAIQGRIKQVRALAAPMQLTYTDLRKRAIESLLAEANGQAPSTSTVGACFDAWLDERQRAADALLNPGAVDALRDIRAAHPEALIGAVTNGRGEARQMPSLAPYFDFDLSGEEDGVFPERKPSPQIYDHALRRACSVGGRGGDADVETLRKSWVHVGDSLVNDVEASSAAGAQTVWLRLPAMEEFDVASFSTVDPEEAARRKDAAEKALRSGCVGRTIEGIHELPTALDELLSLRGGARTASAPADRGGVAEVAVVTAASFVFVGSTCTGLTTARALVDAQPLGAAIAAGLRSGQRWGRLSAGFSGVRGACRLQRLPDPLCSILGAAAAGALGATSPGAVPVRMGAYVALAIAFEAGGPQVRTLAARARRAVDDEIAVRREIFARPSPSRSAPPAVERGAKGSGGPFRRVQQLVDQLNAELGH